MKQLRTWGMIILAVLSLIGCGAAVEPENSMGQVAGKDENTGGAPKTNSCPIAEAGIIQNIPSGSIVTLDGSGSSDPDNNPIHYNWFFTSKPEGSSAELSDPGIVNPTFLSDAEGEYIVSLVVDDGGEASAPDTVTITASHGNSAPGANAGSDRNVSTGTLVTLDGSGSSDADGDPLTYAWSFVSLPGGSSATLTNPASVNPTFTPDVDGTYVISLVVNDGAVDSTSDTVSITASLTLDSVTLTWDAPTTNADGSDLTDLAGYKIYYGTSSGSYPNVIDVGNVTTYSFDSLSPGAYYIVVTAYDVAGNESGYSNEVSKVMN